MDNKKLIEETFNLIEERLDLMRSKINECDDPLSLYTADFPTICPSWNTKCVELWNDGEILEFNFSLFIFGLMGTYVSITLYTDYSGRDTIVECVGLKDYFKYRKVWKDISRLNRRLEFLKREQRDIYAQEKLKKMLNKYKG